MAWAVEIFFDESGEGRVRSLWNALRLPEADATLYEGASRPHLSLAVLDSQDGALEEKTAAVAGRTAPFGLVFGGIGAFPEAGALYLRPEPSGALQALYREMLGELGTLRGRVWPLYLPGQWTPHATVAMGLEEASLRGALRKAVKAFAPFAVRCRSLAVVKFRPVAVTGEYPLGGTGYFNAK